MGYDDDGYDQYLADWKDRLDQLLEEFGSFWVAHARLIQAAGMIMADYLGIPEERRDLFGELFLEDLSLSRAAGALKRIIQDADAVDYRDLPKRLRRIGETRNRLAHDALELQSDTRIGWPEFSKKSLFGRDHPEPISADEISGLVRQCADLEDRLWGLLAALTSSSDGEVGDAG